jgi:structure-specific recognition protein 1
VSCYPNILALLPLGLSDGSFVTRRATLTAGNEIAFQVQGKPSFEIPLSSVANSNIAGKNEVAIEFNPPAPFQFNEKDKDSSRRPVDELVEMRFYVPGKSMKQRGSDAGSDDDESEHDEDGNAISAAEALHTMIKDKADIGALVGDTVVVFEDVLVLTPRCVLATNGVR